MPIPAGYLASFSHNTFLKYRTTAAEITSLPLLGDAPQIRMRVGGIGCHSQVSPFGTTRPSPGKTKWEVDTRDFSLVAFSSSVSLATFDFPERHWTTTGWLFLLFPARFIAKAAGRCQVDSLDLVTTETASRAHPADGKAEQRGASVSPQCRSFV